MACSGVLGCRPGMQLANKCIRSNVARQLLRPAAALCPAVRSSTLQTGFSSSRYSRLLQQRQPCPSRKTVVVRQAGDAAENEDDEQKKDWKFGRNEGGMAWGWKLCAAILYMLPWVDVTEKTVYFIERFPVFAWTEYFTEPFEHWFYIHEWAPLIIFFGTYLGIVRNKKIPHVARYHIMMGVMLDIVAMILIVVEENLPFGVLWTPWSDLFYALMFWFVFLLVMYCLFFCFMGWYCEIPLISEGVYMQIEQAEQMGQGA
ncbi:hypothetical protein OEZ85_003081 [Tetradesmus obliquus]|uniref:Protein TIC 20 n=1 Tax=Tetradesmus obliquus TaxID=3088 RepID=A0ABY8TZL3_TETOB|nr:hypothetical protein OEZ85_003081 [Tetradesmus obliquus]